MEIPTSLKRLIRMVMRGFYSVEHTLVVDMLIRKPCMKEEELETLLKFERKFLRSVIAQLKNDKILKAKLRMETGPDGKTTRQNYYYINYRGFVNVVKYKLDHMRRKIETEERDSTSRASFICTSCKKTFTDLEADQLCDLTTGEFRCSYCGELVEEDPNVLPKANSRLIIVKFNEQIDPLFMLLKQVEDLKLPSDLLEPEPVDISVPVKTEGSLDDKNGFNSRQWKETDKNGGINNEYENMLFNEQSLTVKIENDSIVRADKNSQKDQADGAFVKKEQPSWLTESTVYETSQSSISNSKLFDTSSYNYSPTEDSVGSTKEILEALLVHENKQETANSAISALHGSETSDFFGVAEKSTLDYGADQLMESDEEEVDDREPMVSVGGHMVPLSEITEEHTPRMSSIEIDEYERLSRKFYAPLYE